MSDRHLLLSSHLHGKGASRQAKCVAGADGRISYARDARTSRDSRKGCHGDRNTGGKCYIMMGCESGMNTSDGSYSTSDIPMQLGHGRRLQDDIV